MVTGAPFCDFVVYTNKDLHIERILTDQGLHQDMLSKLAKFYYTHAMPFITNLSKLKTHQNHCSWYQEVSVVMLVRVIGGMKGYKHYIHHCVVCSLT